MKMKEATVHRNKLLVKVTGSDDVVEAEQAPETGNPVTKVRQPIALAPSRKFLFSRPRKAGQQAAVSVTRKEAVALYEKLRC
jgi:hypothetical protein